MDLGIIDDDDDDDDGGELGRIASPFVPGRATHADSEAFGCSPRHPQPHCQLSFTDFNIYNDISDAANSCVL
jgi:hypothetical protein